MVTKRPRNASRHDLISGATGGENPPDLRTTPAGNLCRSLRDPRGPTHYTQGVSSGRVSVLLPLPPWCHGPPNPAPAFPWGRGHLHPPPWRGQPQVVSSGIHSSLFPEELGKAVLALPFRSYALFSASSVLLHAAAAPQPTYKT